MSLTRNTVKAAPAVLCAALVAVSMAACGRDEPNLVNGKANFVKKCGVCHTLARAGTKGTIGPSLDTAFQAALHDGFNRDTIEGIVHRQILHPNIESRMPAGLFTGSDAEDVAAYVGYAADRKGQDTGALATAGLSEAKTGDQIFTAGGCASCHTFAPAKATGTVGPNLNQLKTQAGKLVPGKSAKEYIRESIEDPSAYIVKGFPNAMPVFKGRLSDKQIQTLIDYLLQKGG